MAWSIAEVARMSGVTARTLRHYDAIGLLTPAYTTPDGHRFYQTGELLRLQQILLLRELGLGLGEIAAAIGSEPDTLTALRRHHTRLLAEAARLAKLAETVAGTITELERKSPMNPPQISRPENLFKGFNPADYDDEARERWPDQFGPAQEVAQAMAPKQTDAVQTEAEQQQLTASMIRMAELMTAGRPAGDVAVQAEVDQHYRWAARYWTPSAEAYRNLGQLYVDDDRFRDNYEKITPGLAAYQRDAMAVYASERLS